MDTINFSKIRAFVESEEGFRLVDQVCKRKAVSLGGKFDENKFLEDSRFVWESLREGGYQALRKYNGQCSCRTFLKTKINWLIIDRFREVYERRRVPPRVSALGKWAEEVFKRYCWKRESLKDIYASLLIEGVYDSDHSYDRFLEDVKAIIHGKNCSDNLPRFVSVDAVPGNSVSNPHGDAPLDPLEALLNELEGKQFLKAVEIVRGEKAKLDSDGQLLVQQALEEGKKVSPVARALGIPDHKARRIIKDFKGKCLQELKKEGIDERFGKI